VSTQRYSAVDQNGFEVSYSAWSWEAAEAHARLNKYRMVGVIEKEEEYEYGITGQLT
jgi:hypothetical protein